MNTESKSISPSVELPGASREEKLFAFSPFDGQEQAPDAAYLADTTLNVQEHVSSVVPTEPVLSHLELEASTNPLPFSTPGHFTPVCRQTQSSIIDSTFQKPLVPAPQHTPNTVHPPVLSVPNLRSHDVIGKPQSFQGPSNLIRDIVSPSDLQKHGSNTNHHSHIFWDGRDNLNVYATPGPTFVCSRPVYFDSPTEDPSLSDPLQPESYELDLNAIDFRWRPFLRSNALESDMDSRSVSPSSPLEHAVPNRLVMDDQGGWHARFTVDEGEYGASSEDPSFLVEDMDVAYLDDVGAVLPSNASTTKSSTISHTIRTWSSPINDVQQVESTFAASPSIFLSPFRDQSEPALLAANVIQPRGDEENIHTSGELPSVSKRVPCLRARHTRDLWSADVTP